MQPPKPARFRFARLAAFMAAFCCPALAFTNFETPPIHPLAISPDGTLLAACNLPAYRVEFFTLTGGGLSNRGSVPVGVDPVSLRFRNTNELWVVNHISSSISVIGVDSSRVLATIDTLNSPEDVVFSLDGETAFVSCSRPNKVQVFDAIRRKAIKEISIEGERPKAMALSPDGSKVFAAIFESGNRSTILGRRMTHLDQPAAPTVVDMEHGPHAGINPPPNLGPYFSPSIQRALTNAPPRVSMIVKKNLVGRWMDDNDGDWTEFVSGPRAAFTGRIPGWDLPDHDVAVIDPASGSVSYISGLMNICMDLAVNPRDGALAVVGTDAMNHIRFEPVLQGVFTRVEVAFVEGTNSIVKDLNPHLDYKTPRVPRELRNRSVGDPRAVLWNPDGSRLYVAGMGSHNVVMLSRTGERLKERLDIAEGPVGLALDASSRKLYVLSRFEAGLSVLDSETLEPQQFLPLFDPTPRSIQAGRRHLYDTHKTSGLGQLSCGSCHVDARFDRLAWDLGNPIGQMKIITTNHHLVAAVTNHFHPMKGPMVTQSLQDIIGHEPFHWRGDRDSIEEFNGTFRDLQAADFQLTPQEMAEFRDFLASLTFPPNPLRNFDNSLAASVPLNDQFALGRDLLPLGFPLPNGNAKTGVNFFRSSATNGCTVCHTLPAGLGPDALFQNGVWRPIPVGTNSAHHTAMIALERSLRLPFKIAQLRSLPDKLGFRLDALNSRAGFGFLHDGSVDTLVRFVQDGFDFRPDRDTADLIAFLLSFTGSDLPVAALTDAARAPGAPSRDVPASVGRQFTLVTSNAPPLLASAVTLAANKANRIELIARHFENGRSRGWRLESATTFRSDRADETVSFDNLRARATEDAPVIFTVVPAGAGLAAALDQDADGFFDQDELDAGSDPADDLSTPTNRGPQVQPLARQQIVIGGTVDLQINATDPDVSPGGLAYSLFTDAPAGVSIDTPGRLTWKTGGRLTPGFYTLRVGIADRGTPPLTNEVSIRVELKPIALASRLIQSAADEADMQIEWESAPGRTYRILSSSTLGQTWTETAMIEASAMRETWRTPARSAGPIYYKVELLP